MGITEHEKQLIEKYTQEAFQLPRDEAIKKITMAYKHAQEMGNQFTIRACANNLGAMYISSGHKKDAEKGLKYLNEARPPDGCADCASNGDLFFNMGLAYEVLKSYKSAYDYFEKAWSEYKKERDNLSIEIDTLKRLIKACSMRKKSAEVIRWYITLEETCQKALQPLERLQAMVKRISLQRFLKEDNSEELDECCKEVDNLLLNDPTSVPNEYLVKVAVLLTQSRLTDRAQKYLEVAQERFEMEDEDSLEQAVVLQNLGTICYYQSQWKHSATHHSKAAKIFKKYSTLKFSSRSPIMSKTAKLCLGQCLASQALALVKMENLDDARLKFLEALNMAKESDDLENKWQMEEVLGAVHFRLAVYDIPKPVMSDSGRPLSKLQLEHMEKSIMFYKEALADQAKLLQDTSSMQDRILKKLILVQTFKETSQKLTKSATQATVLSKSLQNTVSDEQDSEDEEATEKDDDPETEKEDEEIDDDDDDDEEEEEEEEGEVEDEDDTFDKKKDRKDKFSSTRSQVTQENIESDDDDNSTSIDDDDNDIMDINKAYRQQLEPDDTLKGDRNQHNSQTDIHSNSISTSSEESIVESASESDGEKDITNKEDTDMQHTRPTLPSQSPPTTIVGSGTYEQPKTSPMEKAHHFHRAHDDRELSPLPGTSHYAELSFENPVLNKGSKKDFDTYNDGYETVEFIDNKSLKNRISFIDNEETKPKEIERSGSVTSMKEQKQSKSCTVM